ncbi:MAG: hypothetical protein ACRYGI_14920 [Janthinobacterium lividum]
MQALQTGWLHPDETGVAADGLDLDIDVATRVDAVGDMKHEAAIRVTTPERLAIFGNDVGSSDLDGVFDMKFRRKVAATQADAAYAERPRHQPAIQQHVRRPATDRLIDPEGELAAEAIESIVAIESRSFEDGLETVGELTRPFRLLPAHDVDQIPILGLRDVVCRPHNDPVVQVIELYRDQRAERSARSGQTKGKAASAITQVGPPGLDRQAFTLKHAILKIETQMVLAGQAAKNVWTR